MSVPDERAFRGGHGEGPRSASAQAEGRWRLVGIAWPLRLHRASPRRTAANTSCGFNCAGYPQTAADRPGRGTPSATPSSPSTSGRAARAGASARCSAPTGRAAPRCTCPAIARASPATTTGDTKCPRKSGGPADGIIQYLELVHELLNCRRLCAASVRRGMSCPARGSCGGACSRSCASGAATRAARAAPFCSATAGRPRAHRRFRPLRRSRSARARHRHRALRRPLFRRALGDLQAARPDASSPTCTSTPAGRSRATPIALTR